MSSSEKTVTFALTAREFRQLVFLAYTGAFIYQVTNTHEQADTAYKVLHKVCKAGNASGVAVLENDRLVEAIDRAVAQQVVAHNRNVLDNVQMWEEFEHGVNS